MPPALALSLLLASAVRPQPAGFRLETVADRSLDQACAMAFTPDGQLLVLERVTGRIQVVRDGALAGTWATVPAYASLQSDEGLLGIAVDPDFLQNRHVYVSFTRGNGPPQTSHIVVARLTEVNGAGTDLTILSPPIPAGTNRIGGPLAVGFDGKLYVATGDTSAPSTAPYLGSLAGKILRMNIPDGSVPSGNPFVERPGAQALVWSSGHRNQFGLTFHPVHGLPYTTENGGSLMDEVNRIVAGGDYGWPRHEGNQPPPDPSTVAPLWVFQPPVAPTGTCFYSGALYPERYRHAWFLGTFRGGGLTYLELDQAGTTVLGETTFHSFPGPVLGVLDGPDGNLWVLHASTFMRGADSISRFVHTGAPSPSLNAQAVSNRAVGGSITLGVTAETGGFALSWASLQRHKDPVRTIAGDLWVHPEVLLPVIGVQADDRAYLGLAVPDDAPNLRGVEVHLQAVVSDLRGGYRLTNHTSIVLR